MDEGAGRGRPGPDSDERQAMRHATPRAAIRGMTLIEILVVLVLIGIVLGIVGGNFIGKGEKAKADAANRPPPLGADATRATPQGNDNQKHHLWMTPRKRGGSTARALAASRASAPAAASSTRGRGERVRRSITATASPRDGRPCR